MTLIEAAIRQTAEQMLAELECNYLEVVLIPSRDPECAMRGGMIRAVQFANAEWYQNFCLQFPSSRKHLRRKFQTKIKREWTRRALQALAEGRQIDSCYADRLRSFMMNYYRGEKAA